MQHDNLLDIHDFLAQDGIRVMEMEWLDGYDLRQLLAGAGELAPRRPRVGGHRSVLLAHLCELDPEGGDALTCLATI